MMQKRIRPEEIAHATGMGKNTVYDLLRSGVIPNIRHGAHFIISRSAFERWWENCGVQQPGRREVVQ